MAWEHVRRELEAATERHAAEEQQQALGDLLERPRPLKLERPLGGFLAQSEEWLERLYAQGRIPREKKPVVFDHLRSIGPWMVSVDETPLSVLDGMSQTATLIEGFAAPAVVEHYVQGGFGRALSLCRDTAEEKIEVAEAYAAALRGRLPGFQSISFVNSGAEACEKALALCHRRASGGQRKLLAFEGSFHGRTLLSLHASFNPAKREPFQLAGYEVTFCPFPVWEAPHEEEPAAPEGYLAAVAKGDLAQAASNVEPSDPLVALELAALRQIAGHLAAGEHFAVMVEPMQSEGGDRYATARFHRALRLLTRHFQVPLIMDEVQTGFGLGGTFAWHERFELVDARGEPDLPDCVTFAKRAQVGVVMSRFEDPEPTSAHEASLSRGLVHLQVMAADTYWQQVQAHVRSHLAQLQRKFPKLVERPRATGYALAFDLPSAEQLQAYLGQRFWQGAVVFGAGERTVRYRLSRGFTLEDLDQLFSVVEQSLQWLQDHPGKKPPAWEDSNPLQNVARRPGWSPGDVPNVIDESALRVRKATPDQLEAQMPQIEALENAVYEPGRRDDPERLALAFRVPGGLAVLAEVRQGHGWKTVGYALAAPIEAVPDVPGPDRDNLREQANTLYSLAVTVDPDFRGLGLGWRLKKVQIEAARAEQDADGSPRYDYITGRNRVGSTPAMQRINRALGAYEVVRLTNQYGECDAQASYYRMPVQGYVRCKSSNQAAESGASSRDARNLDMGAGLTRPFQKPPASLEQLERQGQLYGPAVNKLTVSNYVTPSIVRAVEWIASTMPELPHLYLTSSRDELVDKSLRALRCHRPRAQVVLGLQGGYLGHTTAAARSLSDPSTHQQGPRYFDQWPLLPHPEEGIEHWTEQLRAEVDKAGGADAVFGLFVEPIQERTGRVITDETWQQVARVCGELGVPVVFVETASACFRSGRGPCWASGAQAKPDLLAWWGGGQLGLLHVSSRYFVSKPLTLISTWDGDELSLIRVHHQLRAAFGWDRKPVCEQLDEALEALKLPHQGSGSYRVITAGDAKSQLRQRWAEQGMRLRDAGPGRLALCPPWDLTEAQWHRAAELFAEASV